MRIQDSKIRTILELIVILYLYYCLTIIFLIAPPFALKALGIHLGIRQGTAVTLGSVLVAEIIAFAFIYAYYKKKGIALGQLGWKTPANKSLIAGLSLGIALLYVWFSSQIPEVRSNLTEVSVFKLWGLLSGVAGAFIEETVFRGYIMARLQQVKMSPLPQVLLTAATFSLLHIGFGIIGMLITLLVGIALGGLYILGRRNLAGPIVCHGLINAFLEPWLLLWLLGVYSEKFAS